VVQSGSNAIKLYKVLTRLQILFWEVRVSCVLAGVALLDASFPSDLRNEISDIFLHPWRLFTIRLFKETFLHRTLQR
jgi:hypothetical protein